MIEQTDFHELYRYPVLWGDMDAAQHVNNLTYLRWGRNGAGDLLPGRGALTRGFSAGTLGGDTGLAGL